jgi:hypothetical protein
LNRNCEGNHCWEGIGGIKGRSHSAGLFPSKGDRPHPQRSHLKTLQWRSGFESAKNVLAGTIHSDICRNIGGDEQGVYSISTDCSAITFKHILLPVWLCAYRYQNQRDQVIVNARTAEVQGERPYSVWKITAAVVSGVVVAGVMYLLFTGNWRYIRVPGLPQPQPQPTSLPVPSQKLPPVPIPSTAPVPNTKLPPAPVPSSL